MAGERGTILLVDDDEVVRDVLAESLGQQGFEIVQAENGEEAVALAIQRSPDLIISDIIMPRMDGWDFCYTLRLMPSTKSIPFIFLTSLDKTPDRIMGIKLGADDYLTKPFSPPEVVFKVKAILRRVAMRKKLVEQQEAETLDTSLRYLLSDMIEFLRHTKRTGMLAIYGPVDKGVIYVRKGEPIHASFGSQAGEAAVYEMLKLESAQVKYIEKEYEDLPENVTMPWQALMPRVLKRPPRSEQK